jgi:hypothetical protein
METGDDDSKQMSAPQSTSHISHRPEAWHLITSGAKPRRTENPLAQAIVRVSHRPLPVPDMTYPNGGGGGSTQTACGLHCTALDSHTPSQHLKISGNEGPLSCTKPGAQEIARMDPRERPRPVTTMPRRGSVTYVSGGSPRHSFGAQTNAHGSQLGYVVVAEQATTSADCPLTLLYPCAQLMERTDPKAVSVPSTS